MPDTVAIIHPNHEGVSVTEVADEVRIAVIQPEGATVSVIYDAGWPAERPVAATVLAVGHTTAPAWLTGDDVWFEAVS